MAKRKAIKRKTHKPRTAAVAQALAALSALAAAKRKTARLQATIATLKAAAAPDVDLALPVPGQTTEAAFLTFRAEPTQSKTAVITVLMTRTGDSLGTILWDIQYRQYMFVPAVRSRFTIRALKAVYEQVQAMMDAWAAARKANGVSDGGQ